MLGDMNDLWMYNMTSTQWTWLTGDNIRSMYSDYGIKGTPYNVNCPGGRYSHSMVLHPSLNAFIMFGGVGYTGTSGRGKHNLLSHITWYFSLFERFLVI